MKIFILPKYRCTALKDKIINVPVKDDDIVNTMTRLPRTPDKAGLKEEDLKSKVKLKNSHQKQLINPVKCFKILEMLKNSGNIHYQFYHDYDICTVLQPNALTMNQKKKLLKKFQKIPI